MAQAEKKLNDLAIKQQRADWVQSTYITPDTIAISAEASRVLTETEMQLAKEATRYRDVPVPPDVGRKLQLLRLQLTLPAPSDPAKLAEVTRLGKSLEADYGRGKYCRPKKDGSGDECLDVTAIERMMAESRDPNELRDLWVGWHKVGAPMRERYAALVALTNEGARELGFSDTGALWRSYWDMPPDQFSAEVERIWQQVRPFYESLHTYVRSRLRAKYGPDVVPATGPIPAHLLGNIWSQEWGGIYPIVAPAGRGAGHRPHRAAPRRRLRRAKDGEDGRGVLHLARVRASAADVLGAVDVREASRPRRRVSRQRVGRRRKDRPAPEDVHPGA